MSGFWLAVALAVIVLIGVRQRTAGTVVLRKALPYVILVAVLVALYAWFPLPLVLSETRRLLGENLGPKTWFLTEPLGVYVVLAPLALLLLWLLYRVVRSLLPTRASVGAGSALPLYDPNISYLQNKARRNARNAKISSILILTLVPVLTVALVVLIAPNDTVGFVKRHWQPIALLAFAALSFSLTNVIKGHGYQPYWFFVFLGVAALGASVYYMIT